jgi:DUF2075 family protein
MIVYQADKRTFRQDVFSNRIDQILEQAFRRNGRASVSKQERASWRNSLSYMDRIIESPEIPEDVGIALELMLPQSAKRIDFVLTGLDEYNSRVAIIVELKQWQTAERTQKDGIVRTALGGAIRETSHPSYQAWSYATTLEDFNEAVRTLPIRVQPCAYLHNLESGTVIKHEFYREHLKRAPVFLKDDAQQLRDFIRKYVRHGDRGATLYEIVNGRIRPSKSLADHLGSMLKGNREFLLIDDQKLVFETALELARKSAAGHKHTLIVDGGPGTGKTVVAINLLAEFINGHLNVQYVTRNAAPREVYQAKLTGHLKKSRISTLFRSSGSYYEAEPNQFDALIVDEAHRLNAKSGLYSNKGENQIKELIAASALSIFFIDDAQRVTMQDIGSSEEIERLAASLGSEVTRCKLESQFRCNGSDGFLAWVDNVLGIRQTAHPTLDSVAYDVTVCDSATELRSEIRRRNLSANKARMVAGYCWPWNSKKDASKQDIRIPQDGFSAQWNMTDDGMLWIIKENSVEQVGCIHTCQGLELDYIGVIFGGDLVIRNGEWVEFPDRRAKSDKSIKGYYKLALQDHLHAQRRAREIIRNTYRTLMTRGMKGCYLYSVDPETNAFLKCAVKREDRDTIAATSAGAEILPFEFVTADAGTKHDGCVPCFPGIQVAAGAFADGFQPDECTWVRLKEDYPCRPGYFVAKVTGESMNRIIPNGAWCLFRPPPQGTRTGKILLVQHRHIQDADTGGCTVKRYTSTKEVGAEEWKHTRIVLSPESNDASFKPITLDAAEDGEFRVIGEFFCALV